MPCMHGCTHEWDAKLVLQFSHTLLQASTDVKLGFMRSIVGWIMQRVITMQIRALHAWLHTCIRSNAKLVPIM